MIIQVLSQNIYVRLSHYLASKIHQSSSITLQRGNYLTNTIAKHSSIQQRLPTDPFFFDIFLTTIIGALNHQAHAKNVIFSTCDQSCGTISSLQKMKQTELALSRLLRYKTLLLVLVKAANVSLD